MHLCVILDPLERINPETDTTLVIIEEALRRGHAVDVCQLESLSMEGAELRALGARVMNASRSARPCISVEPVVPLKMRDTDAVLIRKDPPFDIEYFYGTLLLEAVRGQTLLVNDPRGLRDANEKLFIFQFPELIAPTWVTRSIPELKRIMNECGGQMIVKPLDGCGGVGIFHVRDGDRNTNAILETATLLGEKLVMAQQYLPAARAGDKRIILLDGRPIGAVLRVPRSDETRGNLHAGGRPEAAPLDDRDLAICAQVGPRCREAGLFLVGLDVIGGYLTEVNVTSPTGVQEIDRLSGTRLEAQVLDWLEARVASP